MIEGWILDLYPSERGMVIWLKTPEGRSLRLLDAYHPTLYVHGSGADLRELEGALQTSESVRGLGYEEKFVSLRELEPARVMRIEVTSLTRFPHFARKLVRLGSYQRYHLFNVDIPPARAYLYERELFPLARVGVSGGQRLNFELRDSIESNEYELPPLESRWVEVESERGGALPSFEDPIGSISIGRAPGEGVELREGTEAEKLRGLVRAIGREDPDLILTRGGDSWQIPYLARRAKVDGILDELVLGREPEPIRVTRCRGRSYFSYGKIYYKPPAQRLLGRVHVDLENSLIHGECGLEGLFELARVTRMPLQEMARSSIGSAMSSMQLFEALRGGALIPWMKREPEEFKTAWKLLEADRGGFIFEPRLGIHGDTGELDFGSFYPAMMERYNISPETVLCDCCPASAERVPELGYHLCERRRGLIPRVLERVLRKRADYKRRAEGAKDPKLKERFELRKTALKWILVTCFGYLGYRNARFGRIEAHEAVTAFARHNLLRAAHEAEAQGFEVVHGIVDSLWVKKSGARRSDFERLCERIGRETGLPISFEGKYEWIVFLPSKVRAGLPVLNRYYGAFEGGELKARGILARRRDTPALIRRAQWDMLERVRGAGSVAEFERAIPQALDVLVERARELMGWRARAEELVLHRQLSRHPLAYAVEAPTSIAARQMLEAGVELHPGQTVAYVVTNARAKNPMLRVRALPLVKGRTRYDRRWYLDLLLDAAEELFGLFGWMRERIETEKLARIEQLRF